MDRSNERLAQMDEILSRNEKNKEAKKAHKRAESENEQHEKISFLFWGFGFE
jgi:hypothetical protein